MLMYYFIIYKITNKVNGKIYIGSHKTKDVNDSYMGSGKYLNRAFKKYGKENFAKEILFEFTTAKEMYDKEAEIVNEDFLSEENTYNLKKGGLGGFDHINSNDEEKSKYAKDAGNIGGPARWDSIKNDPDKLAAHKLRSSLHFQRLHNEGIIKPPSFKGKTHTSETKQKMRESKKGKSAGMNNSQYNTCWIYSLTESKSIKISLSLLDEYLSLGWVKGRKMFKV